MEEIIPHYPGVFGERFCVMVRREISLETRASKFKMRDFLRFLSKECSESNLVQPRPQGLLWFGARSVTKTLVKLATIRNLIGQHLTLHLAFPEHEFSLEGARSARFLLLKRFQNVLSH